MKNFLSLLLSFLLIIATVPLVSLAFKDEIIALRNENDIQSAFSSEKNEKTSAKKLFKSKDNVKVYLCKDKKTEEVSKTFYIISVLAKEIYINSPAEALKAQAVCINTFLKRTSENIKGNYDISDNPAHHQAYISKKELKKAWGEDYEKNYSKLKKIVESVEGEYMSYNGETALACYHSANAGFTESAENYWGEAHPYLKSVASIGDSLGGEYISYYKIKPSELKKKLMNVKDKSFTFPESPSDWIGGIKRTKSLSVSEIEIAGNALSGRELRELLSLKSAVFYPEYKNGEFVFTVYGYGHAVGLSQEGAIYMAKLGFDYRQILAHYYNGVEISR